MSLYPSVCSECKDEYTVMQNIQHQLRCWICLQGAHDCQPMTAKAELISDIATKLSSFVWLCYDCLTLNNPFPSEQGKPGVATPGSGTATPKPDDATDTATPKPDDAAEKNAHSELEQKLAKKLEKARQEQAQEESTSKHRSRVER